MVFSSTSLFRLPSKIPLPFKFGWWVGVRLAHPSFGRPSSQVGGIPFGAMEDIDADDVYFFRCRVSRNSFFYYAAIGTVLHFIKRFLFPQDG